MSTKLFGDVRSVLQQTPSEEVWFELAALLDDVKARDFTEDVANYIAEHFTHEWPDDVERLVHKEWIRLTKSSLVLKRWRVATTLADALDLSNMDLDNKRTSSLAGAPELAQMRRIDLSRNMISVGGFKAFVNKSTLTSLEHLDMSGNYFSKGMLAAYEALAPKAPNLKAVKIHGSWYDGVDGYLRELADLGAAHGFTMDVSAY